jgi:methyltransferase (TIGR00027 family)
MIASLVENTFDTARMTAFCRAVESERKNACIDDPYARLLAGPRGEEIVRAMGGKSITWPIAVRTCVYDEIILRLTREEEIDTVINLAAGLDTRPYRLSLPASLRWIEVDFPAVLSYKEEKLMKEQPQCILERVPLDVADDEARTVFLSKIGKRATKALVLTEGLLAYLTTAKVSSIAHSLHEQETIRWWLTELISPRVLAYDNKRWNTVVAAEAQTRFAPPGGPEFFQLLGWHVAEFRSLISEGLRLQLPVPYGWLLRLLARISPATPGEDRYNAGGLILLERVDLDSY